MIERTFAMGYVPQTSAPTFGEARLVFGKAWSHAMESPLKDLFPKATIKVENADYKDVMPIDGLHVEAVTVVDESMDFQRVRGRSRVPRVLRRAAGAR